MPDLPIRHDPQHCSELLPHPTLAVLTKYSSTTAQLCSFACITTQFTSARIHSRFLALLQVGSKHSLVIRGHLHVGSIGGDVKERQLENPVAVVTGDVLGHGIVHVQVGLEKGVEMILGKVELGVGNLALREYGKAMLVDGEIRDVLLKLLFRSFKRV
jgi:hypothetical protein